MSRDSLMGHLDRRMKTPASPIRVKDAVEEIYKAHGFTGSSDVKSPNSAYMLESECYRRALTALEPEDRETVRACVNTLSDRLVGRQFGEGSAMQVIAKLGIFLDRAEKRKA